MNKTRFITCLTILMIGLLPLCSTSYAGQVSSTTKARSPKRGKLLKKPNKKKVKRGTFLKNKALTFTVVIAVTLLGGWGVKKFVLEIQERRKEEVEEPIQEDILTPKKTEVKKPEQVEKPKKLYVPKIVYNKRSHKRNKRRVCRSQRL